MARAFAAVFALVLLLVGGTVAMQGAFENAGSDEVVINESFTPGSGGVVTLDNSEQTGAYYDNETTVYDENDTEMEAGTDYQWIEANGTINVLAGGDLADDSEGLISYSYQQTTEEQRGWARVMAQLPSAMGFLLPLFVFVLLLLLVKL